MSDTVLARLSTALEGRYRLDHELGAGGMATVYLAHDVKHDRDVAIKVLHPDLGAALGGERLQRQTLHIAQDVRLDVLLNPSRPERRLAVEPRFREAAAEPVVVRLGGCTARRKTGDQVGRRGGAVAKPRQQRVPPNASGHFLPRQRG